MKNECYQLWVVIAVTATVFAMSSIVAVGNSDTFGHLAAGRQIIEQGEVSRFDTFSFWKPTPQRWINYEWLSDIILWVVFDYWGYNGLIGLKAILLAIAAALLIGRAWLSQREFGAWICSFLLIASIPAIRFRFSVRPHLFGMVLGALFLYGLFNLINEKIEKRSSSHSIRWILILSLAHLAWVNLHGSNLLGLVFSFVYLIVNIRNGKVFRKLFILLLLQICVSCISPFGPAILLDSIRHVFNPVYRELVSEWAAWSVNDPVWLHIAPTVQTIVLAMMVRTLYRRGPSGRASIIISVILATMAFRSIRFVGEYLLFSAPLISEALVSEALVRWLRGFSRQRMVNVTFAVGVILAVIVPWGASRVPPYKIFGTGVSIRFLPAGIASWLEKNYPAGRILAAMEDSWYLIFALPKSRVLLDGRVPFYGTEHTSLVIKSFNSPAILKEILERFGVDTVVVRHVFKGHRRMLKLMSELSNWRLVMVENRYAAYLRFSEDRLPFFSKHTLRTLVPGYEPGLILSNEIDLKKIDRELYLIGKYPNTSAYRSWIQALVLIHPLVRNGTTAGIVPPETPEQVERIKKALKALRNTTKEVSGVPTVDMYHAMVAVSACKLDEALEAISRVRMEDRSRETLFLSQEIALRRGEITSVQRFLDEAYDLHSERAKEDEWIKALSHMLASPPSCAPLTWKNSN